MLQYAAEQEGLRTGINSDLLVARATRGSEARIGPNVGRYRKFSRWLLTVMFAGMLSTSPGPTLSRQAAADAVIPLIVALYR